MFVQICICFKKTLLLFSLLEFKMQDMDERNNCAFFISLDFSSFRANKNICYSTITVERNSTPNL